MAFVKVSVFYVSLEFLLFKPLSQCFDSEDGSMAATGASDSDGEVAFSFMGVAGEERSDQGFEVLEKFFKIFVFVDVFIVLFILSCFRF